jgi:hypothetical protein
MNINKSYYDCPHCGSENTRKLSLINRDGISRSRGVAFNGKGLTNISGTHQTVSSHRASAPIHPDRFLTSRLIVIMPLLLIAKLGFPNLLAIISLALAIYLTVRAITKCRAYSKDYPELLRRWNNGYECQRCEKVFTLQ